MSDVLADPSVHGDTAGNTDVDGTGRSELCDFVDRVRHGNHVGGEAGTFLSECEDAALGNRRSFYGCRAIDDVDPNDRQNGGRGEGCELRNRFVVDDVLVSIGDHRPSSIPSSLADDVDRVGKKRVCIPHDGPDVEIVLPVLDCNVERMSAGVEVSDNRLTFPVAVLVGHVACIAVREQILVVSTVRRPGFGVGTDTDRAVAVSHLSPW